MHTQKKVVRLDTQTNSSSESKTTQDVDSLLRKNGFEIIHTLQEEKGVHVICQETPDVVLLDIDLDKHSVWDLYHQIRQSRLTCNIPVILITEKATRIEDVIKIYAANAADCLIRPFSPQELVSSINQVLN